jgi:hypothetical protein
LARDQSIGAWSLGGPEELGVTCRNRAWVRGRCMDAVGINRNDHHERTEQISKMRTSILLTVEKGDSISEE